MDVWRFRRVGGGKVPVAQEWSDILLPLDHRMQNVRLEVNAREHTAGDGLR